MSKFPVPKPPYVQAYHTNEKHKPTAIVLSLSWTTSDKKAALGIANRLHKGNAPVNSYHYMVDEAETYRGVWDHLGAASTPHGAIDILLCGQPQEYAEDWLKTSGLKVLERTSDLVSDLILAHKIRPVLIEEEAKDRWLSRRWRRRGGIIDHIPGEWPIGMFMDDVLLKVEKKQKEK